MRKLIFGSILGLILSAWVPIAGHAFTVVSPPSLGLSASGTVLNTECFAKCLRAEQQDQCKIGDQVICKAECQQMPEIPIYYNGVPIQTQIEYDDGEPIRVVLPSETACRMCEEDSGIGQVTDNVPRSNSLACVVSTSDTGSNLCSALGISTTTATVHLMDLSKFADNNFANLPFNELLWPCRDFNINPTEQQFTASYPKCQAALGVETFLGPGVGCYETRPLTWQAQGCPVAAGCCSNTSVGCRRTDVVAPIDSITGNGIY